MSLNLEPQAGETDNFTLTELLTTFTAHAPLLRLHGVIADQRAVQGSVGLRGACEAIGAELIVADLASTRSLTAHDPDKYAAALRAALTT